MKDFEPHPSHVMTDWEHTIVTLVSTPRFGKIRRCRNCDAEHAITVSGVGIHDELRQRCRAIAYLENEENPYWHGNLGKLATS